MLPRLLSRLARLGGVKLLDNAVGRLMPAEGALTKKGALGSGLAGAALMRIASRSVPGAIIVGGGMLAKFLYDRRHPKAVGPASPPLLPVPASDDNFHEVG